MKPSLPRLSRREFFGATAVGAGMLWAPGAFADQLEKTIPQTEGPFYPDKLPLDTDNDLLIVNDAITPAVGEVTHLTGRILDRQGNPIRNALVEIWQVDNKGAYIHTKDTHIPEKDKNFQGFGRFLTGSTGDYYFRTIKPVLYPGRNAPHPLQDQEGQEGAVDDPMLRQRRGDERQGWDLSKHSRHETTRRRNDRLRAHRRVQDRRALGSFRRDHRLHAGDVSLGVAY